MDVVAGLNANFSFITPLEPFCHEFYGFWPSGNERCDIAIAQMPDSEAVELYEVNPGPHAQGPYNLPAEYINLEGRIINVFLYLIAQDRWL